VAIVLQIATQQKLTKAGRIAMTHVTYLGHAGFLWETDGALLAIDPWVSAHGAFDSGWFQLPRNHDQEVRLLSAFKDSSKQLLVYVTHHHKDHFDLEFLQKLPRDRVTLLLPRFERDVFARYEKELSHLRQRRLADGESFAFAGGELQVFLEDSGINRDSAVLVRSPDLCFFDMNDAKVHERLGAIKREHGTIDIFACQFSGATWHPARYSYPPRRRAEIAREKTRHKFEALARSIEVLSPRLFLPSAGPACFLDPDLFELNFEEPTSFPRAAAVERFLAKRLRTTPIMVETLSPGDTISVHDSRLDVRKLRDPMRDEPESFRAELLRYQSDYLEHFQSMRRTLDSGERAALLDRLGREMSEKLAVFEACDQIAVPLFLGLDDEDLWLKVDFAQRSVTVTNRVDTESYYAVRSPAWQLERVLDRHITWEDWYLTFRATLDRQPDRYDTLLNGFLWLETEDLQWFCRKMREHRAKRERARFEWNGCVYETDRYCPHQGADLTAGYVTPDGHLVCPRHRWKFKLDDGGKCASNDTTIAARPIELPLAAMVARRQGRADEVNA
jgi:UDP-MurNAc hydroxylase